MLPDLFLPLLPLFFVAVFLILLRQSREDDRIRWWIYAWLFEAFATLTMLPFRPGRPVLALHFLSAIAGLAANICCILSSPALRKDTRGLFWAGLGLGVPTFAFASFVFFGNGSPWPLYLILALGFSGGAAAAARRFRNEKRRLTFTLLLCAWSCIPVALALSQGDNFGALSVVFVQTVLINILMFWWNYPERTAGLYVTLSGFALWIVSSPGAVHFFHKVLIRNGAAMGERFVGIGMVMILIQESLKRAHRLTLEMESLFAQSPHMMWVVDEKTLTLVRANQAAADAHGYSLEEFQQLRLQDFVDPTVIPNISKDMGAAPRSTTASPHMRKDGTRFLVDIEAREILIEGKRQRLIMGIDVTEREALLERLAYEASHDHLTGLYSRKGLMAQGAHVLEESKKKGRGVALASISLRQFKAVNDTYGDCTGDQCLQVLAHRIEGYKRDCDTAGRTSGDGFKVLYAEISGPPEAERLASGLLAILAEPIVLGDISIRVRVSIGLATAPEHGYEMAKLRSEAQTALWEAKKLGVNKVCPFLPEYAAAEVKDLRIEAAMEEMLENGTFEVHYQPICEPSGEIRGLEALLRMNHPTLGPISPAVFIPIAEESGLIIPLGHWILERVCIQINEWKQQGVPLVPVAVNISALQFQQSDFSSRIVGTLLCFDIPSRLLHLELTESTVLQNISDALQEMQKLSANGIRFSIDDFGTGYSSLGRLQEMPISTLKIDRSFIRDITADTSTTVAAVISLAHALGMKVIAEGVEDEEQLEILGRLDCDLIQGYFFSKPLSPQTLEPLLYSGSCARTLLHARESKAWDASW